MNHNFEWRIVANLKINLTNLFPKHATVVIVMQKYLLNAEWCQKWMHLLARSSSGNWIHLLRSLPVYKLCPFYISSCHLKANKLFEYSLSPSLYLTWSHHLKLIRYKQIEVKLLILLLKWFMAKLSHKTAVLSDMVWAPA